IIECRNILLQLTENEETTFVHPIGTLGIGVSFSHYDYILWSQHGWIRLEGLLLVDAFQQRLRDSVLETETKRNLVSINSYRAT
ncbi:MAG: hypothetical protein Q9214_001400, partial [Letrouitia sp. 1 TL-2023]